MSEDMLQINCPLMDGTVERNEKLPSVNSSSLATEINAKNCVYTVL
jgi:hypothetical protein